MALDLYNAPQSTCSQKVRIAFGEKNLDWIEHHANLAKNGQLRPEYPNLHPNVVVATLVDDGNVTVDSSVILEYLDEVFRTPCLSPADPVRRALMRAWMRCLEEVPTDQIRVPSFHLVLATRFNDLNEAEFRMTESGVRPLRKDFYRLMGPQGFNDTDMAASLDELKRTVDRMETVLEKGPRFLSENYTLADIIVAPSIDRLNHLGLSLVWSRWPCVAAWYERMLARLAFKKADMPGSRLSEFVTLKTLHLPVAA